MNRTASVKDYTLQKLHSKIVAEFGMIETVASLNRGSEIYIIMGYNRDDVC